MVDIPRLEIRIGRENLVACFARSEQPEQPCHREPEPPDARLSGANSWINRNSRKPHLRRHNSLRRVHLALAHLRPALRLVREKCGLLLLVGVEDRGDALEVGGERLDAGTLDLEQLADGAVARTPAAVHRFGQFLIGHVGQPHRHSDLAPEPDREPDILVQQPQGEIGRVVPAGQKPLADPVDLWEAVRQGATGRVRTFDRLGQRFLTGQHDPADFALRLLHKDVGLAVGLGREVGVPMRLANLAYEELTEAMNRGWGARNSTVGQLLQVERAGIPPLTADPKRIAAVLDADKEK